MKINFKIHFNTQWGQLVRVYGNVAELGADNPAQAVPLQALGGGYWGLQLTLPQWPKEGLTYKYQLYYENGGHIENEWAPARKVEATTAKTANIVLEDSWRSATDTDKTYYTAAFTKALMRQQAGKPGKKADQASDLVVRFQLTAPRVAPGHVVALSGSIPELGEWEESKVKPMANPHHPSWEVEIPISSQADSIAYKFCMYDTASKKIVAWENGDNRVLFVNRSREKKTLIVNADEQFRYPGGAWRGAGVAIPVFSLRSKNGLGVGEFLDLKPLVDWAVETNLKLVQVLPINDTTATGKWTDSYPYAAISVFALHPMYLNLQAIGKLSAQTTEAIMRQQQRQLNAKAQVDYEAVMRIKMQYLRIVYREKKEETFAEANYQQFFKENREWLVPYAVFCYLRDLYGTPAFSEWNDFATFDWEKIERLTQPDSPEFDDVAIHYFTQYHLHKQLLEATEYARAHGVVLKGDIPIGIYRNSVDAWMYPGQFHMDAQAGAPPDDYSATGQNWRFPTYNWAAMAEDGFLWWRKRLQQMATYFDAYRIDHILGFFRIWQIPIEATEGLMGYFNPAIPLYRDEFTNRGIWFDFDRLCKPYIREHLLPGHFGELTEKVKANYLDEYQPGCFQMKPAFDTQRKVTDYFTPDTTTSLTEQLEMQRIKNGLNALIGNVVLFEEKGSNGTAFHPRNAMHFTDSYKELDGWTRQKLDELYIDYFYRRQEDFWRQQAIVKLPGLKAATNMLICGEDLGMVPACVPGVMDQLNILTLEIQRMPKGTESEFSHPADAPYLSVCSPSCHDMSTVRGWWEEDHGRSQRFYNQMLGHAGGAPYFCEPYIVRDVVVQHLYSPAMWAIFPIQDLVGMDGRLRRPGVDEERINLPSNPEHYWRYRFHINIEDLCQEVELNQTIKSLVEASGRNLMY